MKRKINREEDSTMKGTPLVLACLAMVVLAGGASAQTSTQPTSKPVSKKCPPVTPKNDQEKLMIEQSSIHPGCWVRNKNTGQLEFISDKAPNTYKSPLDDYNRILQDQKQNPAKVAPTPSQVGGAAPTDSEVVVLGKRYKVSYVPMQFSHSFRFASDVWNPDVWPHVQVLVAILDSQGKCVAWDNRGSGNLFIESDGLAPGRYTFGAWPGVWGDYSQGRFRFTRTKENMGDELIDLQSVPPATSFAFTVRDGYETVINKPADK
jgi:hypothetical protein